MNETTQAAETTNPAQENISIFPEDAQASAQTPATEGDKDQSQNTDPLAESIADPKAEQKPEGDKPKEGEETKPKEEEKPAEGEKPKDGEAPKEVKLELSKESVLTEDELKSVMDYAKQKGLDQEAAQKMLDMREESVKRFQQDQAAMVEERKTNWLNETKADKEIGGENFATSVAESSRVVKAFFSETFQKDLENSGLGNYKEFVRGFARIGKLISDDKLVKGGVRAGGEKSIESYFYEDKK